MERLRTQDGQTLVEFALVLPLLLLLLLGIFDIGRAFNYQNSMTNMAGLAVRFAEVSRCAACTSQTTAGIEDYVRTVAPTTELANGSTVTICYPRGSSPTPTQGQAIVAKVAFTIDWFATGAFGGLLPTTIQSESTGLEEAPTYTMGALPRC